LFDVGLSLVAQASARNKLFSSIFWNHHHETMFQSLQFTSAVQQFELFVSGHMYILANRPKREDVLQLALLLPDSSDVFQQATAMVHGDRKKSWFKWRYVHMYTMY